MLQYKWLNGSVPILEQLPAGFSHAALLLHPFIQMPKGSARDWNKEKFFSDEEIIQSGTPVKWEKIMQWSGLTIQELAIALQIGIGALRWEDDWDKLLHRVDSIIKEDLHRPIEDIIPAFFFDKIAAVLKSNGAHFLTYHDPIKNIAGRIDLSDFNPLEIGRIAQKELILADENLEFAFMNQFDSLYTLFMTKNENISQIVESMDMEAIICTDDTYVDWYFTSRQ